LNYYYHLYLLDQN